MGLFVNEGSCRQKAGNRKKKALLRKGLLVIPEEGSYASVGSTLTYDLPSCFLLNATFPGVNANRV